MKKGWRIAKLWVLSERKEVKYPAIVLFGVACLFCGSMAYMSFIDKKPASLSIAFGLVSCLCVAIIFTFLIEEDE
ncbi:MAG: hypothetical protein LBD12_06950 [Clostridiales Family XIII bacterium]|nr:hypothetical protein [Clostridiales Family XIII bacterium]